MARLANYPTKQWTTKIRYAETFVIIWLMQSSLMGTTSLAVVWGFTDGSDLLVDFPLHIRIFAVTTMLFIILSLKLVIEYLKEPESLILFVLYFILSMTLIVYQLYATIILVASLSSTANANAEKFQKPSNILLIGSFIFCLFQVFVVCFYLCLTLMKRSDYNSRSRGLQLIENEEAILTTNATNATNALIMKNEKDPYNYMRQL